MPTPSGESWFPLPSPPLHVFPEKDEGHTSVTQEHKCCVPSLRPEPYPVEIRSKLAETLRIQAQFSPHTLCSRPWAVCATEGEKLALLSCGMRLLAFPLIQWGW